MLWTRIGAGFLCVFAIAVSANMFAATMWDWVESTAGLPGVRGVVGLGVALLSLAVFLGAAICLYREGHRLLDTQVVTGPVQPRRVLITGLSALNSPQLAAAERLVKRIGDEPLSMAVLADRAEKVKERIPVDEATLPWVQNIRALWSHQARIERLVVVPSRGSEQPSRDSAPQFPAFRALINALIAQTPEFAGRHIEVVVSGKGVNYDTHKPILRGLDQAKRQVLKTPRLKDRLDLPSRWLRGSPPTYGDDDISFDMTPGTKAFSVAVVLMTLSAEGRCLYVDNNGDARGVNCSAHFAGVLR